ncbi:MAG: hypothetical protein QUS07_06430 [Methanothrix sp.]|nr:hypothetical protein [Methanothrix sp.]
MNHLLLLFLVILLAASGQAMPAGTQSWTEEPWNVTENATEEQTIPTLSPPVAFNITGNEPSTIRLGDAEMNYSDHIAPQGACELWILDEGAWCQYKQVASGDVVDLIAYTPYSGYSDIYLISYFKSSISHFSLKFPRGYNLLKLTVADSGRMFMIMAFKNQPSNALIIDVLPRPQLPSSSPVDVRAAAPGKAKVSILSESIRGYEVYVDGVFYSSDAADGALDGNAALLLSADGTHTITISQRDGQGNIVNKKEHTKDFKKNTAYTLRIY